MKVLFGPQIILIPIFIFLLLAIITIAVGFFFVKIASRRTKLSPLFWIAVYISVPVALWLLARHNISFLDFWAIAAIAIAAPLGALLGLSISWLLMQSKRVPRWLGTFSLFASFAVILGSHDLRSLILENLGLGPTLNDVVSVDYSDRDHNHLRISIPRPYFLHRQDRSSERPKGPYYFLKLCYPKMTPWTPDCTNTEQRWALELSLAVKSTSNNDLPGRNLDLSRANDLRTLSEAQKNPETPLPDNFAKGLRFFSEPESAPEEIGQFSEKVQYFVPTSETPVTFFFICRQKYEAGSKAQCRRRSSGPARRIWVIHAERGVPILARC